MKPILNRLTIYIVISSVALVCVGLFLTHRPLLAETTPKNNNTIAAHIPTGDDIEITIDQIIADGLTEPVQVTHAGDGSGRLFVVEKPGRIRIIENGALLATPFLDIRHLIRIVSWEQGLLSLAFHPDYEQNGYFYLYYTDLAGDTVVARYSLSDDANIADPNSAFTILTVDQPGANHNGGQLAFGPFDNYLYIGLGDGGTEEPYAYHSQDRTTLLGKLLRIYVSDVSQDSVPYQIPPTNPYTNMPEYRDEIWAFGLRNPWRFSFDRETGDLYLGDVGHNQWEEVDYLAAGSSGGVNFGWSCLEATQIWNEDDCGLGNFTAPIVEYQRFVSDAVIGGFVYRGQAFPALSGRYFYAEFNEGKIWSLYKSSENNWSTPELELDTTLRISAFGEDEDGELYVVDYDGTIRRLADASKVGFDLTSSKKSVSTPHADPGEVITYTIILQNTGTPVDQTFFLVDEIPNGLAYVPGSLHATSGTVDEQQEPILQWQGRFDSDNQVSISYQVTVTGHVTRTLINQATLTGQLMEPITLTEAVFVPRPVLTTTKKDFFLPGTQPNQLIDQIPNPEGCDFCHTEPIYDQWRGSMMSQAGRDPLFWAALYVANNDAPNVGDYCLRCHTPKAWLEGRSHPLGSALQSEDIESGVSCELCHRMVDPVPSMSDEAVAIDAAIRDALTTTLPLNHVGSAMMILDPQDNRRGPFSMDNPYHTAWRTDFLGQSTNYVTESRMCGTCHNLDNPILSWDSERNQYWPNEADLASESFDNGDLFPIERTYDEWLNSQYATTGVYAPQFAAEKPDGIVGSCQDCHMPRRTGKAAEESYNPVERDCVTTGCLPVHQLVGGNTWVPEILQDTRWRLHSAADAPYLNQTIRSAKQMLQKAATLTVTLSTSDTHKIATVRVTNETGHKLPTGYPEGRRMWLNFRAYNEQDELIYESGAYDWDTAILTSDPEIKIYEAKHGFTPEFAEFLERPAGESFHFAANNIILKDNRIPPRGYTQAAFEKPGLEPVGATYEDGQYWDDTVYTLPLETESVIATLYYQTSSKEYIDFLRENGGPDGALLGELWDDSKSGPEVMAVAFTPSYPFYLPLVFR